VSEHFGAAAARLAGIAGVWFGWAPDQFWSATPDELASLFAATLPNGETPPNAEDLAQLREQHPDG
jgi:hypothetical protein